MKSVVIKSNRFSDSVHEIICERNFIFEPGNCVNITNTVTGMQKPYSIASSPTEEHIRFFIKIFPSDTGVSQFVSSLQEGDTIEISEPFGYFTPGATDTKYIYIATGTGLAPFLSAMKFYEHQPEMILYGARTFEDMLPIPLALAKKCKLAVSQPSVPVDKLARRVTEFYDLLPTDKPEEYTYYLCGLDEMISDASHYLTSKGVPWNRIQVEQFFYKSF